MSNIGLIIVLGRDFARGKISNREINARIDMACLLARRNPNAKLLLSGGFKSAGSNNEADYMFRRASKFGVEKSAIIIEKTSKNSFENILFCKPFIEQHIEKEIVIVSSFYHLPRIRLLVRNLISTAVDVRYISCKFPRGIREGIFIPYILTKESAAFLKDAIKTRNYSRHR